MFGLKVAFELREFHVILLALVAVIFFAFGLLAYPVIFSEDAKNPVVCSSVELSQADKNFLGNLAYAAGFCERMGLVTNVFVQQDKNTAYGVPICVSPQN